MTTPDIPGFAAAQRFLARLPGQLLIAGQWVDACSGATFATFNPADETLLGALAAGGARDIAAAVTAARDALTAPAWAAISPHERTRFLLDIAQSIDANRAELAVLDTLDNGMPLTIAGALVDATVEMFRYYAGWCTKIYGTTNPSEPSVLNYTLREPIGVCGQITAWNGPLVALAWKLGPALACGNTVVLKPAEQTSLSAIRLGELIVAAGLPAGVVNIVTGLGRDAGAALVAHPDVDKIAFTGSTATGKAILAASADGMKRVTLELGGKSPNIIFADADLQAAAASAAAGFCMLSGQMCIAGTRIFVERSVHDRFVELLAQEMENYAVGDPFAPATQVGPLVSRAQFDKVAGYIALGREEGAQLRSGGVQVGERGYFLRPALFVAAHNGMRIAQEEIFGPVALVIAFDDEPEAIELGNAVEFGLAAAVWTRDVARAHRIVRSLKAGTVWINAYGLTDAISPFGGYKQSGIGRELGRPSIDMYTEEKSVFAKL